MTATSTRPAKPFIAPKETAFRGRRAEMPADAVIECDREGGRFGAGLIPGVSLIMTGEALGHEYWIDEVTLDQVERYGNSSNEKGLKCRWTHPGLSSDGLGRLLGRIHNIRRDGNRVVGDLHIAKLAHDTPEGSLAEYVMCLVDEDASAAGLSIVFHHDFAAEDEFMNEHLGEVTYEDHRGREVKRQAFQSPDPDNVHNYPHVRLSSLNAADIVDEPAANNGMFDRQTLPREMDELLSYAAGLSQDKPEASAFGVDADRASQFLSRWLDSHGLSLSPKEPSLATTSNEPTEAPETAPTRDDFAAELNRYCEKFGSEYGAKWFAEGKTYEEALSLHAEALEARIEAAETAQREAEEKLSSLELGETEPVATGASNDGKGGPKRFAEFFGKQNKN
ncbi:hypothetical protein [Aporhodopirellula aestuarii]|uniref:Uncharacterized protein n=1 Tax=Aporhodopirellula aestuarii TaxID=2950107 RepID=A0ABT0TYG8_9BACT|nr:hypothetical protein [Aporhodopirellula aestuarii]MCM2369647.1 hypothetical protein [Aporhodopirellula aestuarii]